MSRRGPTVSLAVVAVAFAGGGGPPAHAEFPRVDPAAFGAERAHTDASPAVSWADLADPTTLTPAEEAAPAGAILARRFNPAMAFVHRDIWPVPVRYAWADGAGLTARVLDEQGRTVRQYEALPHRRLADDDWSDLPTTDADGRRIHYAVDAPGDDRMEQGVSAWRRRWRAIMNGDPLEHAAPAAFEYAPTQHAHLFWFNRAKGLLAIQYWFYFPYNEWINHHEGDWEHVNVILRGPSRLDGDEGFRPVGYQFFFHEFTHEPHEVVRVGGSDPREDHVVVYTGGRSQFLRWQGLQSGGSFPMPGVYTGVGGGVTGYRADEDVSRPERFIRPEDFAITMLPEPDRLDVGLFPELSWLRLDFFAGQAVMHMNPLALNGMTFGSTPRQPARQEAWNNAWIPRPWQGRSTYAQNAPALPSGWTPLVGPPISDETSYAARKPARRTPQKPVRR
ncbi:MAG: hypothetical protein KA712_01950 [Myxococcales bacterium]|nr:hypothetical protein [Myxococcales bacterium]